MFGYSARKSILRFAVSEFNAAFDALYAERGVARGTRPSTDEMLMR
jgi:hypothetical protein